MKRSHALFDIAVLAVYLLAANPALTGIPLPFVSYGSSFMVVNFALIGLIGSVYSHTSTQSGFARTPSHGRKAS